MWIVDKQLRTVRSLSGDEAALLTRFVENSNVGRDVERANSIIRAIRADNHWLACACAKPVPVMHIALLDSGRLVIRNNPDGAPHAGDCKFAREMARLGGSSPATGQDVTRIGIDGHIALHAEFSSSSRGNPSQISRSGAIGNGPRKRVLSLLLSLIEASGLNRYDPSVPRTLSEQFAALRQAADAMTIHPGLPLGRFFDTRINQGRLIGMAKRLRETTDFGQARRIALLADLVEGIAGREILLSDSERIGFFGHVERRGAATAPSLALATVTTQQPGLRFYELGQVAAVPVASKRTLFPIHAMEQREHVLQILGLLDWLQRKGVPVVAVRKLFAAGSDHEIELRHKMKIVVIDLTQGIEPPAPTGHQTDRIMLSQYPDIDVMKRHLVKIFMEFAPSGR